MHLPEAEQNLALDQFLVDGHYGARSRIAETDATVSGFIREASGFLLENAESASLQLVRESSAIPDCQKGPSCCVSQRRAPKRGVYDPRRFRTHQNPETIPGNRSSLQPVGAVSRFS